MIYYLVGFLHDISSNKKEYKKYLYWRVDYINENNEFHRKNGPAREYSDGRKLWYKDGKLHREDGPAQDFSGDKYYWYNGEFIDVSTDKEFKKYLKMKVFI
jgi:hypothetical protein